MATVTRLSLTTLPPAARRYGQRHDDRPGHRRRGRGASTLIAAAEPRCGGTVVVAVDGPSGAGKTTLTRALRRRLDRPPVLHLDARLPRVGRPARARRRSCTTGSWHRWRAASGRRTSASTGRRARSPRSTRCRRARCSWWRAAAPGAWPGFAYVVGPDLGRCADRDVRFERAIARDGETYRPNWERWAASERALFARRPDP